VDGRCLLLSQTTHICFHLLRMGPPTPHRPAILSCDPCSPSEWRQQQKLLRVYDNHLRLGWLGVRRPIPLVPLAFGLIATLHPLATAMRRTWSLAPFVAAFRDEHRVACDRGSPRQAE
jgi:hypothetical protein